jgi:hypothetical protein
MLHLAAILLGWAPQRNAAAIAAVSRLDNKGIRMKLAMLAALAAITAPALAQDSPKDVAQDRAENPAPRDLCSELGGLDTPACIVDPGKIQVEVGMADWTLDKDDGQRKDTIDTGEILLRYGVTGTTEVRVGWTAFGYARTRDFSSGTIDRTTSVGDVTLGVKQSISHPAEGKTGLAVALLPYATLPSGRRDVGAGDWGGGLIIPTSYKLSDDFSLEMTPEVDAAVDDSGSGRHLAYGTAFGVQAHLGKTFIVTPEVQFVRDRDPSGHATMSRASVSLDYQPQKYTIVDLEAIAGLNRATPDIELAWGITRKF